MKTEIHQVRRPPHTVALVAGRLDHLRALQDDQGPEIAKRMVEFIAKNPR